MLAWLLKSETPSTIYNIGIQNELFYILKDKYLNLAPIKFVTYFTDRTFKLHLYKL